MSRLWRTHARTVESRAVFSLNWIRKRKLSIPLPTLKWLSNVQKRFIISSDYFPQYKRNDHLTRVNMRNIYTSSQTQSQRHISLQHLQKQRPNKVGLLCGAAQIIRKKVDKWFCTQWLALWQTPHFWQGHRLRQQCNWKSTLFYFLTPTFFMAILWCFVSGLLSINFG